MRGSSNKRLPTGYKLISKKGYLFIRPITVLVILALYLFLVFLGLLKRGAQVFRWNRRSQQDMREREEDQPAIDAFPQPEALWMDGTSIFKLPSRQKALHNQPRRKTMTIVWRRDSL